MSPRDHSIDAVRAVAIGGVVGGHWLVTGLYVDAHGALRQASPLAAVPWFAPASWLMQTLGLFFFAGGFAAARSGRRLGPRRLIRPVTLLAGIWTAGLAVAAASGVPGPTLRTIAVLVVSPLWFLLPYVALTLATRPLIRLVDRTGPVAGPAGVPVVAPAGIRMVAPARNRMVAPARNRMVALAGVRVVALAGIRVVARAGIRVVARAGVPVVALAGVRVMARAGVRVVARAGVRVVARAGVPVVALAGVPVVALADLRLVPGWVAVPAAWSVPWILGVALARGRLRGGSGLMIAGVTGMAVLIIVMGYPASAVGVPGQGRSNLDPPSLLAVALAATQIGLFLMLRPRLTRPYRPLAAVNRRALPIYLTHQSVLVVVTSIVALTGSRPAGLLTAPTGPAWAVQRLLWLPVLAAVLVTLVAPPVRRSRVRVP